MRIETKHGAHVISYDEEGNTWHCKAMRLSAPSLAQLRTQLNAEDREERRIDNIRAFVIDRYREVETEVVITMIDTGRNGVNGHRVVEGRKKRDYFSLSSLVVINDKNAPKIEHYKAAVAAYREAAQALDAAHEALPHPTLDELVALSSQDSPVKSE